MPFGEGRYKNINLEIIDFQDFNFNNLPNNIKINVPHYIDFNLIVFYIKGDEIKLNVNFKTICFREGEILIIPQKSVVAFNLPDKSQGFTLIFDNDFLAHLFVNTYLLRKSLNETKKISLTKDETKNILLYYNLIYNEYNNISLYNKLDILRSLVKSLLFKLEQKSIEQNPIKDISFSLKQKLDSILQQNHSIEKTISFYAQQLGCTTRTLNKLCYSNYGLSSKKVINQQLLFESKKLLLFSNLSIKEIAFQLGFTESTNFSKFFKREGKQSPTEFLKAQKYLI